MSNFSNPNNFNNYYLQHTNRYGVPYDNQYNPYNNMQAGYISSNGVALGNSPEATAYNFGKIGRGFYEMGKTKTNDGIYDGWNLIGKRPTMDGKAISDAQWASQIKNNPDMVMGVSPDKGLYMGVNQNPGYLSNLVSTGQESIADVLGSGGAANGEIIGEVGATTTAGAESATTGAEAAGGAGGGSALGSALPIAGGVLLADQLLNKGRGTREVGKFFSKVFGW